MWWEPGKDWSRLLPQTWPLNENSKLKYYYTYRSPYVYCRLQRQYNHNLYTYTLQKLTNVKLSVTFPFELDYLTQSEHYGLCGGGYQNDDVHDDDATLVLCCFTREWNNVKVLLICFSRIFTTAIFIKLHYKSVELYIVIILYSLLFSVQCLNEKDIIITLSLHRTSHTRRRPH